MEILQLQAMLRASQISHEMHLRNGGRQFFYPNSEFPVCDVIEFPGSYGYEQDKLELMGLLTPEEEKADSVVGFLTARNVFERIRAHHRHRGMQKEQEDD